jgi:peptidoglycan/xylan/chitin deacetylase (PgdA/CDA1 family)
VTRLCLSFDNMGPGEGWERALADGYPRLLDALDRLGLRASFFIEGWNGEHHPDRVAALAARGHEVGLHGWDHEQWAALSQSEAEDRLGRGLDALTAAVGERPRGFRAPAGDRGPYTAALLAGMGFDYDASLGETPAPTRLPEGIATVPFQWSGVDGFHYLHRGGGPADLRTAWTELLDQQPPFLTLIAHASISAVDDERFEVLDQILARVAADESIEVVTAGEAAAGASD